MEKVLVGMSGGVDSSVCALLLHNMGYESMGATLYLHEKEKADENRTCCSVDDIADARAVAERIGIKYGVYDYRPDFSTCVMDNFVSEYCAGRTPNPCVQCNKLIKFPKMLECADTLGCAYIATGHYARVARDAETGRYLLKKGKDHSKDQSYVLYNLTQELLSRLLLPIGEYEKAEIRRLAEENGLINANKPDSQDICFIPDGDYVGFLKRYGHANFPKGNFVDTKGAVLGEHRGLIAYTTGQRKGLGVGGSPYPLYVLKKKAEENAVVLGREEELFSAELTAEQVNWVSIAEPSEPLRVMAKTRYSQNEAAATVYPQSDGRIRVAFDQPQRALTCGQSVVLYDGELVLGGGLICDI